MIFNGNFSNLIGVSMSSSISFLVFFVSFLPWSSPKTSLPAFVFLVEFLFNDLLVAVVRVVFTLRVAMFQLGMKMSLASVKRFVSQFHSCWMSFAPGITIIFIVISYTSLVCIVFFFTREVSCGVWVCALQCYIDVRVHHRVIAASELTVVRDAIDNCLVAESMQEGSLKARFMGPTWDPSGADRTQVGPMLAPWTLLSGRCLFARHGWDSARIVVSRSQWWPLWYWRDPCSRVCLSCGTLQWCHNEYDGVWNHMHFDCLLNLLFGHRAKWTTKLCVTDICEGKTLVTGGFPSQRASSSENVFIWWHHHVCTLSQLQGSK